MMYISARERRRPDGRDETGASRNHRGKSGLHRAGCQVTPGHTRRELRVTDSATESKPPQRKLW